MKTEFTVVAADKRFDYLSELLNADGYISHRVKGDEYSPCMRFSGVVILPYPCINNGKLNGTGYDLIECLNSLQAADAIFAGSCPGDLTDFARKNDIKLIDYAKREDLLLENAALTAEAALNMIMCSSEESIRCKNVIVCGYGRIGERLVTLLSAMGAFVTVAARSCSSRCKAKLNGYRAVPFAELSHYVCNAQVVFNTVPNLVIDKTVLSDSDKECLYIDLASLPGGIDFEAAERFGLKAERALGLPGKYAPKSAACIIKKAIYNSIEDEELFK